MQPIGSIGDEDRLASDRAFNFLRKSVRKYGLLLRPRNLAKQSEDHDDRPTPATFRELFSNVQKNYFRMYFHYTYFNLARYAYLNVSGYIPLLAMSPSILAGTLTLGIYQQVQNAFGEVASSFQFFARAWTTIVELMSIYARLHRFEALEYADNGPRGEWLDLQAAVGRFADPGA